MPNNLHKLLGGPAAIHPDRWQSFLSTSRLIIRPSASGSDTGIRPDALFGENGDESKEPTGGIAVIRMCGVIVQEAGRWDEYFGLCGLNRRRAELDAALGDSRVSAVVLYVDSPGGVVFGLEEFSDYLFAARQVKPVYGFVGAEAYSAGYWVLSACQEVSITPSGGSGSIGVWTMHIDESKWLEQEGIKITLVKSGRYKVELNPYEPLTEEAEDYLQLQTDEYHSSFVGAVARNRGVTAAKVLSDFGEGRTMSAKMSVDAGLCDRVETIDALMGRIMKANRKSGKQAADLSAELELL